MKTKQNLCAALLAAFTLSGAAFAATEISHPMAAQTRGSGNSTPIATPSDTTTEPDTIVTTRVLRYPGRVGSSVMNSPQIIKETFTGQRTFVNEHGFFQNRELEGERGQR